MNRDDLLRLLRASAAEAAQVCAEALQNPAVDIRGLGSEYSPVERWDLLRIYRRRADHARRGGSAVVGLDETVAVLGSTDHEGLRLVVMGAPGAASCVLFLSPDLSELVSAVAVLPGPGPSGPPAPAAQRPAV